MSDLSEYSKGGLNETLGVEFTRAEPGFIEARMPITSAIAQPFGFVHGGATISLLESVASLGSQLSCDLETERPFGIEVNIRHRKSGREGWVHATATLDRTEPSSVSGIKQYWLVTAKDDAGDVMSEGYIMAKIVSLEYLASRQKQ